MCILEYQCLQKQRPVVKKGDLVPMDVEKIALPQGDEKPVPLMAVCPAGRAYLQDMGSPLVTDGANTTLFWTLKSFQPWSPIILY